MSVEKSAYEQIIIIPLRFAEPSRPAARMSGPQIKRPNALTGVPGAALLYTCDLDAARAADLAKLVPGCTATVDFKTVLADTRVHAVIVATLNAALAPITLAAVRAGKHVLVEKPGALNAAQLRTIRDAAQKSGARVRFGYNHRYH